MTAININPNPAQNITANVEETFENFRARIFKDSKRPIRFENGQNIELQLGGKHAVLMLQLADIATPEQFEALMFIIMQAVTQATINGVIPPDWFQGVATLFNLLPPEIPEQFQDEQHEIKVFLTGETQFALQRVPIVPDEPEIDEEDDE
jgi:hypothetical protein